MEEMEAAMKEMAEEAGKTIDGIIEEADRELLEAKLKGLTVAELRDYARKNCSTFLKGLYIAGAKRSDLIQAILEGKPVGEVLAPASTPAPAPRPISGNGNGKEAALADALASLLEGRIKTPSLDEEAVSALVQREIERALEGFTHRISVSSPTSPEPKDMGVQHYLFPKLLKIAARRKNVALVGPAGSGKTTVVHNVATALDLPFYCMSVSMQTTKSDLFGFIDASGRYIPSMFRKAYEHGGVFCLDEIDAGNANVLVLLNSATANGLCSFPDGMIEKHKDFVLFACANTFGLGNDRKYVGRNQMDAATRNRFLFIEFPYDEHMEMAISPNKDWTRKVQSIRRTIAGLKEDVIASPRASIHGADLLEDGLTEEEVLDMLIFQGVSTEVKNRIMSRV
ncbi:MAG: AAA family ATPase [Alphaproteobacteria bacterium]|uniref:AAA family ATPase n=1 Tax=Candidatus Nitrobium versatile TaxID=2884831 RepID=A0A953SFC2_9BACT|nr:AAA family ATPase [Candidatus Nitrobium versatile]